MTCLVRVELWTFNCELSTAFSFTQNVSSRRAPNSFVSLTYANTAEWGPKTSKQHATISSITCNSNPFAKFRKTHNHYRFSDLSNKRRRADIPVSGIPRFPVFYSPISFRLDPLALLKTYNCELTTTLSARRHFHLGNRTNLKVGHYQHLQQAAVALRFSHFRFSIFEFRFSRIYRL
jgi:hypothetical protein